MFSTVLTKIQTASDLYESSSYFFVASSSFFFFTASSAVLIESLGCTMQYYISAKKNNTKQIKQKGMERLRFWQTPKLMHNSFSVWPQIAVEQERDRNFIKISNYKKRTQTLYNSV